MLICKKCGHDNPLGRVFCGSCGGKLDLSHVTQDMVNEAAKVNGFILHWRKFVAGIVAVLALLAVIALIPQTGAIGESGTPGGGRRVEAHLRQLGQLPAGRAVSARFQERDINGYFEFIKISNIPDYDRVTVNVENGFMRMRLERTWFSLRAFGFEWQPKATVDLMTVPAGGGGIAIRKAAMGRLPLAGPFRKRMARRLHRRMAEEGDWSGLSALTEVDMRDNTVHVVARR